MENSNNARKHAVCGQSISDAHILGSEFAADIVAAGADADIEPETLAAILEAVAVEVALQAALLRGGRVRQ